MDAFKSESSNPVSSPWLQNIHFLLSVNGIGHVYLTRPYITSLKGDYKISLCKDGLKLQNTVSVFKKLRLNSIIINYSRTDRPVHYAILEI